MEYLCYVGAVQSLEVSLLVLTSWKVHGHWILTNFSPLISTFASGVPVELGVEVYAVGSQTLDLLMIQR